MALYSSCVVWGINRNLKRMPDSRICLLFGVAVGITGTMAVDVRVPGDGRPSNGRVGDVRAGTGGTGGMVVG